MVYRVLNDRFSENEGVTTRVPVVATGVIEVGKYLEEYSYYRLNSEMKNP